MAEAKKIPVAEYKVQLTLTRTEARLVHKLVGATVSYPTADGIYHQLQDILGGYGSDPSMLSEVPAPADEAYINAGYKEP